MVTRIGANGSGDTQPGAHLRGDPVAVSEVGIVEAQP